ncbi:hypothetical protein M5D96_005280 [Drosophila gunungcola]|uniref:Uncharacterized protein n=2 Tax=Drosophila gunungcola TaxID=103775 RepID=A0A9Q0BRE4_9MUSC|nr:hypothetical protein M5D96_005280 [Drosophila gunungcola]
MRPRRSYKAPLSQKIAIHKRNVVIVSDEEENTSEYSHSPSSQHSTLESNTDIASAMKKTQDTSTSTNSCSEPEDDSSDSSDEEQGNRATKARTVEGSALAMGAVRSSDIISIPTFEADGAVNMV